MRWEVCRAHHRETQPASKSWSVQRVPAAMKERPGQPPDPQRPWDRNRLLAFLEGRERNSSSSPSERISPPKIVVTTVLYGLTQGGGGEIKSTF